MSLEMTWQKNGRAGNVTLSVVDDGQMVAVDICIVLKEEKRKTFLKGVMAKRPELDAGFLESRLLEIAAEVVSEPEADDGDHKEPDHLAAMPEAVRASARVMLESPDLLLRIRRDIEALGVAGERELAMTIYLAGVSRLLSRPIALIVQGPTSSGKSYAVSKVSSLFPPEVVVHATQMTPQSLFHMKPGSLRNRFVVAGERSRRENDDTADCTRALREMISAGRLVKLMPEKLHGEIITRQIEQEGPISYVETTTLARIFDEDLNRCFLLHTDERREQTRRVLDTLAGQYEAGHQSTDVQEIVERHYAAQRMLQVLSVIVPYARKLSEALPADKVELRRAYPLLIGCVQASALLHQFQRQVDAEGNLLANGDDYALARHLLAGPMAERLGERLPEAALRFLDTLRHRFGEASFTSKEARKGATAGRSTVNGWLGQLGEGGFLEIVSDRHGNKPAVWRVLGDVDDVDAGSYLPAPELIMQNAAGDVATEVKSL